MRHIPPVLCKDGFKVSIQASEGHYCYPRNSRGPWEEFELGFPSSADPLIAEYAEDRDNLTQTVYPRVPVATIEQLLDKHGGTENVWR
jgi:hypothetical protein